MYMYIHICICMYIYICIYTTTHNIHIHTYDDDLPIGNGDFPVRYGVYLFDSYGDGYPEAAW